MNWRKNSPTLLKNNSRPPEIIYRDIEDVFTTAVASRDFGLTLLVARKLASKLVADIIANKPGIENRTEALFSRLSGLAEFAYSEGMSSVCRTVYAELIEAATMLRKGGPHASKAFNSIVDTFVARIVFATESESAISEYLVTDIFPDQFYRILSDIPPESLEFEAQFSTFLERMVAFARAGKNDAAIRMMIAVCQLPEKFLQIKNDDVRWTRAYRYLRAITRFVRTGLSQSITGYAEDPLPRDAWTRSERLMIQGMVGAGIARELIMNVGLLAEWKEFLHVVALVNKKSEKLTERASHEFLQSISSLTIIPVATRQRKQKEFLELVKFEIETMEDMFRASSSAEERDFLAEHFVSEALKNAIVSGDEPIVKAIWEALGRILEVVRNDKRPEFYVAFENLLVTAVVFAQISGAPRSITDFLMLGISKALAHRQFKSEVIAFILDSIFGRQVPKDEVLGIWNQLTNRSQSG